MFGPAEVYRNIYYMRREGFSILVDDIAIKGTWFAPPAGERGAKGNVVLCHGVPGGTKDPADPGYAQLAETLAKDGHCVTTFNFRGAGESGGDFDIRGWLDDLRGVLSWVCSRLDREPVLFGFSAGAAVCVSVAAEHAHIAGLILCACPAEFSRILDHDGLEQFLQHARAIGIIRNLEFPADRVAWAKGFRDVCAKEDIRRCGHIPALIIHGDDDELIPVEHAYQLYHAARGPKQLAILRRGGHRLRLNEAAIELARKWLANMEVPGVGIKT